MQKPRGNLGEALAADHLRERGYIIRAQNWRITGGELDIIAEKDDQIVFVEVKTRTGSTTDTAFESLTARKRAALIRTAESYLASHELTEHAWRVDVIAIALRRNAAPIIEHVENALDW